MLLSNTYICGEKTMPLYQNISKPCELVRSPVYLDSRNKFQALGVLIIPRNESQVWQSSGKLLIKYIYALMSYRN